MGVLFYRVGRFSGRGMSFWENTILRENVILEECYSKGSVILRGVGGVL